MEYELKPEPAPEAREAIERALELLHESGHPAYESAWRRRGIDENLAGEPLGDGALAE